MTKREFLNAVIDGDITDEIRAFAEHEIDSIDRRNAKRASTPSKAQLANEPLRAEILTRLKATGEYYTASDVAAWFGVNDSGKPAMSVQKSSSLLHQLVADGLVKDGEIKLPKKGRRRAYKIKDMEGEEE